MDQKLIESALRRKLREGTISRKAFIQQMFALGLGMGGVSALSACTAPATQAPAAVPTTAPVAAATTAPAGAATAPAAAAAARPLTPSFYQWIIDLHPGIVDEVNKGYDNLNFQIAPVQGYDIARFVAEAKEQKSTWDVYVGMTPFVEMAQFIKAGVIEPWDDYIPKDILDDIMPSVREECTVDGKLYSWPFVIDVVVSAYNNSLVSAAGLPDKTPADWDEYLASAKTVVDKGAARYGCTFDSNGWRSLCPITHSFSPDVYYTSPEDPSGVPLFDFTNENAIKALEVMKKMLDLSSANALQPGATDGGVNQTPDEIAFGAENVAYYVKYQNAPTRFAERWKDKTQLRLGPLPKGPGGAGGTVFWTTGACLFKYGQNKELAAEYMKKLVYTDRIWKDSVAGSPSGKPAQLPPFMSLHKKWAAEKPEWFTKESWVPLIIEQLGKAKAIPNNPFGLSQFQIAKPIWEKYLTGADTDAKKVMQECKDAVIAEIKKTA